MKKTILMICALAAFAVIALAADPPALINYQGVLRDASDKPRNGSFNMSFYFYSAETGGDQILIDQHADVTGNAVTVSGGLFNVQLGSGTVTDGSGPGTYASLTPVFRDYPALWLEIQVGAETLTPRARVVSAGFALNAANASNASNAASATTAATASDATNLNGQPATYYLDTSSNGQTKRGPLKLDATAIANGWGLEVRSSNSASGAFIQCQYTPNYATIASPAGYGIYATGTTAGGHFRDAGSSGVADLGYGDRGIEASGTEMGGYFNDSNQSGYARVGYGELGIEGVGNDAGGTFRDGNGSGRATAGFGDMGIWATGNTHAGYFDGHVTVTDQIEAYGSTSGGYFKDSNNSGYAYIGYGDRGIDARGTEAGGVFVDSNNSGWVLAGYGDYGVEAGGNVAGGHFVDANNSGYAYVGYGDRGIEALGSQLGGYFKDADGSGTAEVGVGDLGLAAMGRSAGGLFQDADNSSYAYVAIDDVGIYANGNLAGGEFVDGNSSGHSWVGTGSYKIQGTGSVSFVENHPIDKDRVIVYAAPEGDEVGVYTRGTARLANGEARVNLGPTFRHVTNPDIGLTVYVTPVGAWSDLFVASKGTEEIVVKSHGGDPNAAFDYIVYGLRIGFEETSIVQEKTTESYIPSMKDHRELYARKPELRSYNALERFKGMRAGTGEAETDFSKSEALKAAIHEYDPATDPPVCKLLGMEPCPEEMEQPAASAAERTSPQPQPAEPARETAPVSPRPAGAQSAGAGVGPGVGAGPAQTSALATATATAGRPRGFDASETEAPAGAFFVVSEPVEAGDLLVLDPVHAGQVRRASAPGDTSVIGIAAGPSQLAADGNSVVSPVGTFYGRVKADAQYGAIRPGDLLVTSATPGCAMKAPEVIAAGTVIGKALEPLETGTGVIRVLVMPR